jgi:hypothetical protein
MRRNRLRRCQLGTVEANELASDQRVVFLQELAPGGIAELCRLRRRTDDVREEDGGKNAIALDEMPLASVPERAQVPLDFPCDRFGVSPPGVVLAGQLYHLGVRDSLGDIASFGEVVDAVARAV